MLDVMYDIPSNDKICTVVVTKGMIQGTDHPKLIEGVRKSEEDNTKRVKTKSVVENAS